MSEILIAGMPLEEAITKAKELRRSATEVVSDLIDSGTTLCRELIDGGEGAAELRDAAIKAFEAASRVADAFGVEFYMEWDGRTTLSNELYDCENSDILDDLIELLEGMESEVAGWNQSNC